VTGFVTVGGVACAPALDEELAPVFIGAATEGGACVPVPLVSAPLLGSEPQPAKQTSAAEQRMALRIFQTLRDKQTLVADTIGGK
jgi:hypothetical protein